MFCFRAASENLREDVRTFYCYRWYKFVLKELLCNSQYFYTIHSDVYLNNTHKKCIFAFPP